MKAFALCSLMEFGRYGLSACRSEGVARRGNHMKNVLNLPKPVKISKQFCKIAAGASILAMTESVLFDSLIPRPRRTTKSGGHVGIRDGRPVPYGVLKNLVSFRSRSHWRRRSLTDTDSLLVGRRAYANALRKVKRITLPSGEGIRICDHRHTRLLQNTVRRRIKSVLHGVSCRTCALDHSTRGSYTNEALSVGLNQTLPSVLISTSVSLSLTSKE